MHSNDFLTKFGKSNLDVLVAGLVTLPPTYSIYLSRAGEHDIRTLLLRLPQAAVVMVGLAQLTPGAALVVQGMMTKTQLAHVWEYFSYVCAIAAAYVGACACRSWAMRRESQKSRGFTFNPLGLPRDLQ